MKVINVVFLVDELVVEKIRSKLYRKIVDNEGELKTSDVDEALDLLKKDKTEITPEVVTNKEQKQE